MKLSILSAKNRKDMESIADELYDLGFKLNKRSKNFILVKKRRYGNSYVHILFILIALFLINIAIFVNIIYFAYSFIWRSPYVLITTEKEDEDGNKLEFDTLEDVKKLAYLLF